MVDKKTEADFNMEEVHEYGEAYVQYTKEVRGVDVTYYGNWQRDFAKLIIELLDVKSDPGKEWQSILDVGCATALNLRGIDELGIFSRLIGIDHSQYLIDLGQKLYDFGSYGEFHATPSWDLSPIEDDDIDALICTHVLEHLPDEDKLHETLEEFQRVLHSDGKIIIMIPCTEEEDMDFSGRKDMSPLHHILHTNKWWSKVFSKYFKSETLKVRQIFKKTKLRPSRSVDESFYDVYKSWSVYRLVHK
jgi:ubiquinone/menaquinone biosynthesis C-methylase UbiE